MAKADYKHNRKTKKKDFALGGKIECPDCGGQWWVSGPQAINHARNGWPIHCGNHPDVPGTGSRNDCTGDSELVFIPYSIEENEAEFRRHGLNEVADGIRPAAEKIIADAGEDDV